MQNSFLTFCTKNQEKLQLNSIDIAYIQKIIENDEYFEYAYLSSLSFKINKLKDSNEKKHFISEFLKILNLNNTELLSYFSCQVDNKTYSKHANTIAPIVLFTYNRIDTLQLTINSLLTNEEASNSTLLIFSDGPKNKDDEKSVSNVRQYLQTIEGFKSIDYEFKDQNQGLAKSIISGLNKVSTSYEQFIVLEDDLICSPYFLNYMNSSLNKFKNSQNIWTINSMSCNPELLKLDSRMETSYYFTRRASSHGWGSWRNRWELIDWDINNLIKKRNNYFNKKRLKEAGGDVFKMLNDQKTKKIDSWAVRWVANIAINNGLCVTPFYSHTSHQFSEKGTHIKIRKNSLENNLSKSHPIYEFNKKIKLDKKINKAYTQFIYKK